MGQRGKILCLARVTKGSGKKVFFLVVRPLRTYPPPPIKLSGHPFFGTFLELQTKLFFSSGVDFTPLPPLLVATHT